MIMPLKAVTLVWHSPRQLTEFSLYDPSRFNTNWSHFPPVALTVMAVASHAVAFRGLRGYNGSPDDMVRNFVLFQSDDKFSPCLVQHNFSGVQIVQQ